MINHSVKVYPSKIRLNKKKQLAWKIAEIASDNVKLNKDSIEIWGTGKPIREWLYVEDGANAMIKCRDLDSGYYFFNVGVNKGYSVTEIAQTIANEISWNGGFTYNTDKPDGVMKKTVNGTLGSEILDWKPEVDLEQGIKKTVEWYLEKNE